VQDLIVSFIQDQIAWHDPATNRQCYESLITEAPKSDLVLLPEMFNTGFSLGSSGHAESLSGESVQWMTSMARESGAVVAGSLMIVADERYFNRLIWMRPDGSFAYYDKRHLFRMAGEHHKYAAGNERLSVKLKDGRICPLVCYDLRFPVWSRSLNDYDLLLYVANWPAPRRSAWRTLLPARAVEYLCYCAGVNRIGKDCNDIAYSGDILIADHLGNIVADATDQPVALPATLSLDKLNGYRDKFPAWKDADQFEILNN